jgi:hypothetical protein
VGLKWYPVKADWIEVALAMDAESGKVSRSAMERFSTENGVEVCTMRWLGRPRPNGQHASAVIKEATKEEAEKLLKSDSVTFGGGGIMVSPFEERRTPVACSKCRRFGHRARDCMRPEPIVINKGIEDFTEFILTPTSLCVYNESHNGYFFSALA